MRNAAFGQTGGPFSELIAFNFSFVLVFNSIMSVVWRRDEGMWVRLAEFIKIDAIVLSDRFQFPSWLSSIQFGEWAFAF